MSKRPRLQGMSLDIYGGIDRPEGSDLAAYSDKCPGDVTEGGRSLLPETPMEDPGETRSRECGESGMVP